MKGRQKKTEFRTAIQDLLDYIDRVDERGITTLSISKIRERLKERLPIEKDLMIKFAKQTTCYEESSFSDTYDSMFPKLPTDKTEDHE